MTVSMTPTAAHLPRNPFPSLSRPAEVAGQNNRPLADYGERRLDELERKLDVRLARLRAERASLPDLGPP